MKKFLILSAVVTGLFTASCSKVSTTVDLNDYPDCFTCTVDTLTGDVCTSDYASISVHGNLATDMYTLRLSDFMLAGHGRLMSTEVGNLTQYAYNINAAGDTIDMPRYFFFRQEGKNNTSGDFSFEAFKFGWLSTIYWFTYTSGPYKGWSLPARTSTYAVNNVISSPYPGPNVEKAIFPKYTVSFDPDRKQVTIKGTGVRFPIDNTDTSKSLTFRSYEWRDMDAEFNTDGFTLKAAEFAPYVDGKNTEWIIRNFKMTFDIDFDGIKRAEYTLARTDGSLTIRIVTDLAYILPDK